MATNPLKRTFFLLGCTKCNQMLLPSSPSSSFFLRRRTLLLLPNSAAAANRYPNHNNHHRRRSFSSSAAQETLSSTQFTHHHELESPSKRNVVEILEERGLIESVTSDNLRSAAADPNLSPLRVYCGFDPTAESLHLGNLIGIVVLSWFLRCGHRAVALVGGATARVGDPSGKTLERPELNPAALEKNTAAIAHTLRRILGDSSSSSSSLVVLNNYDWWKDFKLLDFLKKVGKYARVGTMMAKESVRRRLESEQGMSYTEFTYQLLQGYDFLYLFEKEGVNAQIGGSDQWGNITAGIELIRKILPRESEVSDDVGGGDGARAAAYGLTFPLLLKRDGTKFGKSEDGAIWLSPTMLSPYKFYQHFFSVPDEDVARFLKTLTFLSIEEISEIEREMKRGDYVPNTAQRRLAEEVTQFVHGQEGLEEAIKATEALRPGGGGAETRLETIELLLKEGGDDVPSCSMPYHQVLNLSLVDLLVSTGLLDTKSAARRLLKQGGIYLNNSRVDGEGKKVEAEDIVGGKILLLSVGKKNKMVVRID